nr:HNH endonuclease signature motif containing protein [Macrococcus goetzii]
MPPRIFFNEHVEYIRDIANGRTYKEITDLFNNEFNMNLVETQIKAAMSRFKIRNNRDTKFVKGQTSWNKGKKFEARGRSAETQFKKGQRPLNYRPIGSERYTKDGYIEIKVSDTGRRWKHKHVYLWERENGEVPKGHAVIFLDGDKYNLSLDNLKLITRGELARLNHERLISEHAEVTETNINLVRLAEVVRKLETS